VRLANFLDQAQQKWSLTALTNAGGFPGSPYFKITVAGTDRALAATEDGELAAVSSFTGAPEQLWRIEQLTDGTWRISPKAKESLALCAIGGSSATLSKVDAGSDKLRWKLHPL
jgi:arabinan endo-1,5-alpha-L-arabinosidase